MTDTQLAVRDALTDQQIQQRIRLHQSPGFGLERATAPQLNNLFLYCQKHQMLPGDDVTLYDGRPFLQIAGVVKAMRRHPEYRGYACHPLNAADKEAWGYDTGDIVIECVIRTDRWGEISARGKVTKDEANGVQRQGQRMNPVARLHPVEMAEKRAIARAQRAAFGLDAVIDEDEYEEAAQTVIEQRKDPVRNVELSSQHQRIFEAEYDAQDRGWTPQQGVESVRQDPEQAAPARQEQIADPVDQQTIGSKKDPVWVAWLKACHRATEAGIEFDRDAVQLGMTVAQIDAATKSLLAEVADAAETTQASAF